MKQLAILATLLVMLCSINGYSQTASDTFFSVGANMLKSSDFGTYYDEEQTPPTFLNLGVTHSWYRTDRKITFNKEIGLNVQYSNPHLSSGGLGAHSYSSFKILNLFAEATVQAQIKIDSSMSVGIGPAVEYLLVGHNKENSSYYAMYTNPPTSGQISHTGFNRNYFGDPLWGVKFSVLNFGMSDKATFKLNFSYFWMKENETNFHSSSYLKVGIAVAFRSKKDIIKVNEN